MLLNPTPTDAYSRFFVENFDDRQLQLAPTGFISLFGVPGASKSIFSESSSAVEIDIVRANGQRLAATVKRGSSSVASDKDGHSISGENYKTQTRKWPLIETLPRIEADKLLYRGPGENPYALFTKAERNRSLAMSYNSDQIMRHLRTMNFLARESIIEGKQPSIIGTNNEDLVYDFERNSDLIIEVANGWNEQAGTPMADIDFACDRLEKIGYARPNFFALGDDATSELLNSEEFQAKADNRRFELIEVSTNNPVPPEFQRYVAAGWIPRGRLRTEKGRVLWIFNYNHTFTNPLTGNIERYMPGDAAFITDTNARRDVYHGPSDRLPVTRDEAQWYVEMFGFDMEMPPLPINLEGKTDIVDLRAFHFDAFRSPDKKSVTLRAQSAPIFATTQTDAIATLKDLIQN